jgi:hypothetical protein
VASRVQRLPTGSIKRVFRKERSPKKLGAKSKSWKRKKSIPEGTKP